MTEWFGQIVEWARQLDFIAWARQLIMEHGYLAYPILIIGTFFEGETILIIVAALAAAAANRHNHFEHPNIWLAILSAFIGSLAGDQTWFLIGRFKGKAFLAKRPLWQKRADKIHRLLEKHQDWLLVSFRFMYGLRNPTPFVVGMSEIKTSRFVLLNSIGAAIWAMVFGWGGYKLGEQLLHLLKRYQIATMIVLACVIAVIWVIRVLIRRRRSKKVLRQEGAAAPQLEDKTPAATSEPANKES